MTMVRAVLAAAVLAGSIGCLDTPPLDPSKQTIAAVSGQVTRQDGSGVGGPIVGVQLLSAVSGGSARLIVQSSVLADENGRFLFIFLVNGESPQTGTVNISVTPPIGSGLFPKDTTGLPVKLVLGQQATDTTFAQIALRPRN